MVKSTNQLAISGNGQVQKMAASMSFTAAAGITVTIGSPAALEIFHLQVAVTITGDFI